MPADAPTILATSGGFLPGERTALRPGPLVDLTFELAGLPSMPRICFVGTAAGDQAHWNAALHAAFYGRDDVMVTCVDLFPMPNIEDMSRHLESQDVIWVGGGSTANLLALWRIHGLDRVLRRC